MQFCRSGFGGRADCPAELYSIIFQKAPWLHAEPLGDAGNVIDGDVSCRLAAPSTCVLSFATVDHYSNCPGMKRPEFFAARFPEVAKNVDGVLVDHLAQLKKRLVWLQIHIGDLLSDLLSAGEDSR